MGYFEDQKKVRIQIIKNSIVKARKARKFVKYDMLISTIMTEFGLSRTKSQEYLKELIDSKFIALEPTDDDHMFDILLSDTQENILLAEFASSLAEQKQCHLPVTTP